MKWTSSIKTPTCLNLINWVALRQKRWCFKAAGGKQCRLYSAAGMPVKLENTYIKWLLQPSVHWSGVIAGLFKVKHPHPVAKDRFHSAKGRKVFLERQLLCSITRPLWVTVIRLSVSVRTSDVFSSEVSGQHNFKSMTCFWCSPISWACDTSVWRETRQSLMTVWQHLIAGGDTPLKHRLNDDSFYESEKLSSAALSGMCLTTLTHSCDLWYRFPPLSL